MTRSNDTGNEGNTGSKSGATQQLRDTAQKVGEGLRDLGGEARDAAAEQYEHLRDTAAEYYEEGLDTAQQWRQSLEDYVQEKPLKSLLIAAGVGMVLAIYLRRH